MSGPERRRDVLVRLGAAGVLASSSGFLGAAARFFFPNVRYEPSPRFSVGRPDAYPTDSVTFLPERRVFIFRRREGFSALSSICTHLGCNVRRAEGGEMACPCHGSRFGPHGEVLSGPAPRPLRWLAVSLSPRGLLVVDGGAEVTAETRLAV